MAASAESSAPTYCFDDRNIRWHKFGDLDGFVFAMYDIDEDRNLVDFILKFEPNSRIFLHRHTAHTNTLVVQGDHIIYEPDGQTVKEVRLTGSYTSSPPGDAHREGGVCRTELMPPGRRLPSRAPLRRLGGYATVRLRISASAARPEARRRAVEGSGMTTLLPMTTVVPPPTALPKAAPPASVTLKPVANAT